MAGSPPFSSPACKLFHGREWSALRRNSLIYVAVVLLLFWYRVLSCGHCIHASIGTVLFFLLFSPSVSGHLFVCQGMLFASPLCLFYCQQARLFQIDFRKSRQE